MVSSEIFSVIEHTYVIKNKFAPLFVYYINDDVDEIDDYVYTRNVGDCTHYPNENVAKQELKGLRKSFPELEDAEVVKMKVTYEETGDED